MSKDDDKNTAQVQRQETVLITGGTGLIGSRLTEMLQNRGYRVTHLSRTPSTGPITTYTWDIERQTIDAEAISTADYIIHLAGASIADKRLTEERKKVIISSRVDSAGLIYNHLQQQQNEVKAFISASAVGYYGDRGEKVLHEDDEPGEGFLSETAIEWEKAAWKFEKIGKRVGIVRIGFVVSSKGGAMPEIIKPMKFGVDGYFGSGKQYYPWIHIDDTCRMFIYILENGLTGVYNAAAPYPVTNKELVKTTKEALGKKGFLLPAPRVALSIALGELADGLLYSANVSSEKIRAEGFEFKYPDLKKAIQTEFL